MMFVRSTALYAGLTNEGIVLVCVETVYGIIPGFPPIPVDYSVNVMPIDF